ncbi:MAG TPA: DUF1592 domain-containing protein [Polyangiaceae bacterium]|nr:DUF1592 domain-containing protein [Polyangiaceae bacterium]
MNKVGVPGYGLLPSRRLRRGMLPLVALALAACSGPSNTLGDSAIPVPSSTASDGASTLGVPPPPLGAATGPAAGPAVGSGVDPGVTSPASSVTPAPAVPASDEAAAVPSARTPLAPRISKQEYTNTIYDVLGVSLTAEELDAAAGGIMDDAGDGVFKHFTDKQTSTEQQALAYFNVAESLVTRIAPETLQTFGSCSEATDTCAAAFVDAVGQRLFRSPLDERALGVYAALFAAVTEDGGDYPEAARAVVHAMLQAPQFLFHIENETSGTAGTDRRLDGYELAARLASFVWVSAPDTTLLDAAAAGKLDDDAGVTEQVERMLQDPKAQRFTETFISQFSRARLATFDGATPEQVAALHESIVATFQHHFWEAGRSVADLFTTTEFVVNEPVAEILQLKLTGTGLQAVDVGQLPERVGFLTHPGMIAGMGDRAIGSFVNRGKYLLERLLCKNPGAFPAAAQTELDAFNRNTEGFNERERAEVRMMRPECWSCHTQFEPLAFGFARFDAAGRYVGEMDADGKALPLDGWVPTSSEDDSPHYDNVSEYMQILAQDTTVQQCMTEHFLEFATAHSTDDTTKANAQYVGKSYIDGGSTLVAMVGAVVQSPLFSQLQTVAVDTSTGATQDAPAAQGGN